MSLLNIPLDDNNSSNLRPRSSSLFGLVGDHIEKEYNGSIIYGDSDSIIIKLQKLKNDDKQQSFLKKYFDRLKIQFEEQKGDSLDLSIKCKDGNLLCSSDIFFAASDMTEGQLKFIEEFDGSSIKEKLLKAPLFPKAIVKDLLMFYYDFNMYLRGLSLFGECITKKLFSKENIENGQIIPYLDVIFYFGFKDILRNIDLSYKKPFKVEGVLNYFLLIERLISQGITRSNQYYPTNRLEFLLYEFIRNNLSDSRINNLFNREAFLKNFSGTLFLLDTLIKSGRSLEEIVANKTFQQRQLTIGECLCQDYAQQLGNSFNSVTGKRIFPQINELREALSQTYELMDQLKTDDISKIIYDGLEVVSRTILKPKEYQVRLKYNNDKYFVFVGYSLRKTNALDNKASNETEISLDIEIEHNFYNRFAIFNGGGDSCLLTELKTKQLDNIAIFISKSIQLWYNNDKFKCFDEYPIYGLNDAFEGLGKKSKKETTYPEVISLEESGSVQIGRSDQISSNEIANEFFRSTNIMALKSGYYSFTD